MFGKTSVPILGIIENMAYFLSPSDGVRHEIFGSGGGEEEARRLGVPFLGSLPLDPTIRIASDRGTPFVLSAPDALASEVVESIASSLAAGF